MFHKNNSNKRVLYTPRSDPVRGVFLVLARRGLLTFTLMFLIWLAWQTLSGGFRQLARSRTIGQKVETLTQIECGLLSLLVVFTNFWGRRGLSRSNPPGVFLWQPQLASPHWCGAPQCRSSECSLLRLALLVSRAVRWALRTECMN
jgi:hypothetical protein